MSKQPQDKEERIIPVVVPLEASISLSEEELFLLLSCLTNDKSSTIPLIRGMVENVEATLEAREMLGYGVKFKVKAALIKLQRARSASKPASNDQSSAAASQSQEE